MRYFCLFTFILLFSFNVFAEIKLLFLGDSLTEGYGVEKEQSFVSLLEKKLKTELKEEIKVMNAGIGGSTSKSGVERLKWHLRQKVTHLVLALGSNDGLRGLPPKEMKKNLQEVILLAKSKNLKILLLGAKAPPNLGAKYTEEFELVFTQLKNEFKLPFVPFILDGVAGKKELNQADGIHPNIEGHKILAEKLFKQVRTFL